MTKKSHQDAGNESQEKKEPAFFKAPKWPAYNPDFSDDDLGFLYRLMGIATYRETSFTWFRERHPLKPHQYFTSYKHIAELCGRDRRTVKKKIEFLQSKGLLKTQSISTPTGAMLLLDFSPAYDNTDKDRVRYKTHPDKKRVRYKTQGGCVDEHRGMCSITQGGVLMNTPNKELEEEELDLELIEREPSEPKTLSQIESESPFDTIQGDSPIIDTCEDCKTAPPLLRNKIIELWHQSASSNYKNANFELQEFSTLFDEVHRRYFNESGRACLEILHMLRFGIGGTNDYYREKLLGTDCIFIEKSGRHFIEKVRSDMTAHRRRNANHEWYSEEPFDPSEKETIYPEKESKCTTSLHLMNY